MERIKQALEKARQERADGIAPSVVPGRRAGESAEGISYSQTRHAPVSKRALRDNRVLTMDSQAAFADAYKILRTQVLQRLNENGWNVLAVTSPGDDEGKTLTAVNLAVSLSWEVRNTVLLVDADLRHPAVHECFGLPKSQGLADYLLDDAPLSDLLVHPEGFDRLVLLPGGRSVPNSAEMLNSPRMAQLVEETKTRYPNRIVVFDLPPVLASADTLAFTPYVDAVLVVADEGHTKQQDLTRSVELLAATNVIGTVLNKARSH